MIRVNQQALSFFDVNGQMVPCEGPRAVPIDLDFTTDTECTLLLQNMQSRNFISMIQAVYIDNSGNTAPMSVRFPSTGQNITIAPNRQGYFIVLCPNPPQINFVSTGGVAVRVLLLNFPVTNSDWPCVTGA